MLQRYGCLQGCRGISTPRSLTLEWFSVALPQKTRLRKAQAGNPLRYPLAFWQPMGAIQSDALLCFSKGAMALPAFVYLLRCADGSLYTGWSDDPTRRAAAHNRGAGAKYTRSRLPVTLVYTEECPDKGAALSREAAIKRLSHAEKERLAAGDTDGLG